MENQIIETIPTGLEPLDLLKSKISEAVALCVAIEGVNDENFPTALETAKTAKIIEDLVEQKRKELVAPLNDEVKKVNAYAKETLSELNKTRNALTVFINDYQKAKEAARLLELEKARDLAYKKTSAIAVLSEVKSLFLSQLNTTLTSAGAKDLLKQISAFYFEEPAYNIILTETEEAREYLSGLAEKRISFLESIEEEAVKVSALPAGEKQNEAFRKLADRRAKFYDSSAKASDRQKEADAKSLAKIEKGNAREFKALEKKTSNLQRRLLITIKDLAAVPDEFKILDTVKVGEHVYKQLETLPIEKIRISGLEVSFEQITVLPKSNFIPELK